MPLMIVALTLFAGFMTVDADAETEAAFCRFTAPRGRSAPISR